MSLSALDDRTVAPDESQLAAVLGRSKAAWDHLSDGIAADHAPIEEVWKFAGPKWGWSLRLVRKKRTVVYLTPGRKLFHVGFVLGEKAVAAAEASKLPREIKKAIREAPRYPEGRGVRFEVGTKKTAATMRAIAELKMAT
jgi:hypothetical protein